MKKYLNDFLLMLQFLTRIPINKSLNCEYEDFKRGALFLPIIGGIIGGIQWAIYYLLIKALPLNIVTVIVILAGILLTGGLHVDGLGDTCDGFYAFKGKDRIIEIMKDSRIGTYACIAIVMDLLLKFLAYENMIQRNPLIIIAIPIASRASIVLLSLIGKPAKSTGSGNLFIGNMNIIYSIIAFLSSGVLCLLLIGFKETVLLCAVIILITLLFNKYCNGKIGGITGDILGANNELVEIISMLVLIGFSC